MNTGKNWLFCPIRETLNNFNSSGSALPQGLKPMDYVGFGGRTEVMPFQRPLYSEVPKLLFGAHYLLCSCGTVSGDDWNCGFQFD